MWTSKGKLSQEAEALVQFRQALLLPIESADQFFTTLAEKLDALERFNAPHPLSAVIAIASLKKFLVEDRFRIELHDLLMEEVERQMKTLSTLHVQTQAIFLATS